MRGRLTERPCKAWLPSARYLPVPRPQSDRFRFQIATSINKDVMSPSVVYKRSCVSRMGQKNVLMFCEQNLQPASLGPIQTVIFLKYTINRSSSLSGCLTLKKLDACLLYIVSKLLSSQVHVSCSIPSRFLLKRHFLGMVCGGPPRFNPCHAQAFGYLVPYHALFSFSFINSYWITWVRFPVRHNKCLFIPEREPTMDQRVSPKFNLVNQ